ncbi:MAG: hypothetical protein PW843_25590 [Azospirillaceae bacterium]|nr:hypothetical protein [Azospirillaceae bacterium]
MSTDDERGPPVARDDRDDVGLPLRERFAAFRARNPLPAATGLAADKAFFDDLCDDL